MLSIYFACWIYWLIVYNTLKIKHCVNKHSLMILSWFFLALLLLSPRCKYFAAATGRLASCMGHMLLSAEGFHINCSVAVPLHCQHTVLSPVAVFFQGISMIGEKGPSFAAGCRFPLPNTQRNQPTGAQQLSLAAKTLCRTKLPNKRKHSFPLHSLHPASEYC